jgi:hypothetical protein
MGFSSQDHRAALCLKKGFLRASARRRGSLLADSFGRTWCRRMLTWLRLPSTVHSDSHYRVWQRCFPPLNVYTEKKRIEKLDYMHNNPAKRRLVTSP